MQEPAASACVRFVDSHTAGEPTRIVLAGGPDLGPGDMATRCRRFAAEHDHFRSAIVNEPRGSDVLVGGLVCTPADPTCQTGVIFFNNVGMLGMCGHGTIGLVVTLHAEGLLPRGECRIETPVGVVTATLHDDGSVSVCNVPSHRAAQDVAVDVPGFGRVRGDVAWGGNWFFLVKEPSWDLSAHRPETLVPIAAAIRQAVNVPYPLVDHIELFGPPLHAGSHSRNFVLCPGGAYDRSPCGTGTSAKLACLAADGLLAPGDSWVQESILGTRFTGRYRWCEPASAGPREIEPTITGQASITVRGELVLDPSDPFRWGRRDGV
jgi:4-hydroxyproline epimerase